MDIPNSERTTVKPGRPLAGLILDLLFVVILLAGFYFRIIGTYWGEYTYMHPDERFLVWVGTDISPVVPSNDPNDVDASGKVKERWISLSEYFDTANSPLNPHNRGHTFYVYGTLPMFLTRFVVQWVYGHSGFAEMLNVGRPLSALADLFTVVLVYLIARRLYDRRVGLLAAAFSAAAVLPIQQSHFFTMDTFINPFSFLAFYFAVRVALGNGRVALGNGRVALGNGKVDQPSSGIIEGNEALPVSSREGWRGFFLHPEFWLSLCFGVALGLAVASKLNTVPMALVLPAAMAIRLFILPVGERGKWMPRFFGYLVVAGFASLVIFRIAQPYAFSGPGFFGLKPNPLWIQNIQSLSAQTGGDVDFPPALQWARRPIWFSWKNLTYYGLGLPLGILAWVGFLAAGWRILKGDWQRHALIWGWTAVYFTWQSLVFNPTMRYQLPIYPTLEIFAAWFIVFLHDYRKDLASKANQVVGKFTQMLSWNRIAAILVGAVVLVGTYAWAYAFTRIYVRQFTRVEASRWIFQNIPGPINLHIQTGAETYNQPLPVPGNFSIQEGSPYSMSFTANRSGQLSEIYLAHVLGADPSTSGDELSVLVSNFPRGAAPLGSGRLKAALIPQGQQDTPGVIVRLDAGAPVSRGVQYYLNLADIAGAKSWDLCGKMIAYIQTTSTLETEEIPAPENCTISAESTLSLPFTAPVEGQVVEVYLSRAIPAGSTSNPKTIEVSLGPAGQEQPVATATLTADFSSPGDGNGLGYLLSLSQKVPLEKGQAYNLSIQMLNGDGQLSLVGSAIANEGDWDDGLPLRIDGYDGFGGLYVPDLNFNMYWDDNAEKLARFTGILDKSEYILISSNRQWGTLPRLPERFPMTTIYYRSLLHCPDERTIEWCYRVAKPGMFPGSLGFELVETVQSNPSIGPFTVNTQFAEEAFTVYDHPKVLIFRKTASYDPVKIRQILGSVDFSQVIHLTPRQAGSFPANLMLPTDRLAEQRQGGTWYDFFDRNALQNRIEPLGVILWYLFISLLGWITYPILRLVLPGLSDHGFPLARTAGLLIFSYLVWLAGSYRIPFTRPTIWAALLIILLAGIYLGYRQRQELRQELRDRWRYFLTIEGISLVFFLAFLMVRLGNGDLWHPYFGGEKPMDFSYFNAVLKSTTFPPYDPWFAGGYLNYYYYGFVFAGVPVKFLGIMPSFAYNLILASMFSLVALGAFSGAYNLSSAVLSHHNPSAPAEASNHPSPSLPYLAGLAAALVMVVLGNLGTLRMIFRGYATLGLGDQPYATATFVQRWSAAFEGVGKVAGGETLPYGIGDWYWIPSRLMPPGDNAITEFPAFTFLYADPHAHLFALPLALLCLGWTFSVVLAKARWRDFGATLLGFLVGGLAIGVMGPTNTWDYYAYLPLGLAALAYALIRYYRPVSSEAQPSGKPRLFSGLPAAGQRLLVITVSLVALVGLSKILFLPFQQWYGQAYTSIQPWIQPLTPFSAYITHWGLFLFILITWMIWEAVDWMATTPVSALRKLNPYWELIWSLVAVLFILTLAIVLKIPAEGRGDFLTKLPFGRGVGLAGFILPVAALAGVLLLRPGLPDAKRIVLFMIGTGLVITLFVELYVLRGDIGRQNTVFKLYLQAWTLFSVGAGAGLAWLISSFHRWKGGWYYSWIAGFSFLFFAAALFTLLGTSAKIKDRMVLTAPRTLDGMNYMQYAHYSWLDSTMDLNQDYRAIRWMQNNIQGSPVIVEANSRDLYRWYSRFTIYTGLPGVVGWEWHQQQQRGVTPGEWVSNRIRDIDDFYRTQDIELAMNFLRRYNVRYIVLGQLERITYPGAGLSKFSDYDGQLWKVVYNDRDTVIYEVIP